jgi:hypothetical protein
MQFKELNVLRTSGALTESEFKTATNMVLSKTAPDSLVEDLKEYYAMFVSGVPVEIFTAAKENVLKARGGGRCHMNSNRAPPFFLKPCHGGIYCYLLATTI